MRRSNARTHSPSPHLAYLRASAPEPMATPLLHLPAHVGYPIRNTLLTQCLVNPTIRLDLSTYDTNALNAIEAGANSAPYLGNEVLRNDLNLDTELRSSNILTRFFIGGGVAELEPGVNLLRDGRAWERVSNTVLLNAIRMA